MSIDPNTLDANPTVNDQNYNINHTQVYTEYRLLLISDFRTPATYKLKPT